MPVRLAHCGNVRSLMPRVPEVIWLERLLWAVRTEKVRPLDTKPTVCWALLTGIEVGPTMLTNAVTCPGVPEAPVPNGARAG